MYFNSIIFPSVCFEFSLLDWYFGYYILFFFFFIDWLIDWLIAVLGLRFCARALSSRGKWGPLFIAVRGPLTIAASPVAEHRLQTRRLSNCGSRAQSLRGMWDPPRPGSEPVSPALAGRLSTTAPPGKPWVLHSWLRKFAGFVCLDVIIILSCCKGFWTHIPCFSASFIRTSGPQTALWVSLLYRTAHRAVRAQTGACTWPESGKASLLLCWVIEDG